MRFGICTGSTDKESISYLKSLGYDYIEGRFKDVQAMDENALREYISMTRDLDIGVESFCIFLKGDFRVVGEDANHEAIREYAKIGFEKAARLGGKTVVFGSGGARRYPEGFPFEKARDQFADCLRMCGDIASQYGMSIVIEPLNDKETNLITTVAEGVDICRYVNHRSVWLLADFYHIYRGGETLDALKNSGGLLKHVHIARANDDRGQPTQADKETCLIWADALKKCGYDGRMSLESAHIPDFKTAAKDAIKAFEWFK